MRGPAYHDLFPDLCFVGNVAAHAMVIGQRWVWITVAV